MFHIFRNCVRRFTNIVDSRNHILPICLPGKEIDLKGRRGIIAGWGKTDLSSGHAGTAILQMASVPIISKHIYSFFFFELVPIG